MADREVSGGTVLADAAGANVTAVMTQGSEAERRVDQAEMAAEDLRRALVLAQAETAGAERKRQRVLQRVHELRGLVEGLGAETRQAQQTARAMADRYEALTRRLASAENEKGPAYLTRIARDLELNIPGEAAENPNLLTIRQSIYFDAAWYLERYPDVRLSGAEPARHYLLLGSLEQRDPGPWFSTRHYLENNPDVAAADVNPLVHYIEHGEREGRIRWPSPALPLARQTAEPLVAKPSLSCIFVSGEPESAGHDYRVLRHIDAAFAGGVHATSMRADELAARLDELSSHDVAIFWRVAWTDAVESAFNTLRARGRKIVFDVDDLMTEPALAQTEVIDGIRTQFLTEKGVHDHYASVRRTMIEADVCFTTTEELAFYLRMAGKTTHVLPNAFDKAVHDLSRLEARRWAQARDGLIRIGYAGGSRTHQRDLSLAIPAVARIMRENPLCRLVLFRPAIGRSLVDVEEYADLVGLEDQIEWRPVQPLRKLPVEMARFDINLAPLEFGNPFCEAKSELKYFEAALVDVPTVASPTGPFRRAIHHGKTGFLAATGDDWYAQLKRLVDDEALRRQIGRSAYRSAMTRFGPEAAAVRLGLALDQLGTGPQAARAFALSARLAVRDPVSPAVFPSRLIFEQDGLGKADATVIVPLYNYEQFILETLDSIRDQTLSDLDLIIVDGLSTDDSLEVARRWAVVNADRFNRILVLQNESNYGLGFCRNSGFDAADTAYVLPVDADNKLLPRACEALLQAARATSPAFVYPTIQHFGASSAQIGSTPYEGQRLAAGNFIDAMALVSKEAWAMVGGFDHVRHGWEDYDVWCRMAEIGLRGEWLEDVLALYRVHPNSMQTVQTQAAGNFRRLHEDFTRRHRWASLLDLHQSRHFPQSRPELTDVDRRSRLDRLLPHLRCPDTKQKLGYGASTSELRSYDGLRSWPVVDGRPILSPLLMETATKSDEHVSNWLSPEAERLIQTTDGLVLNLSAGSSVIKYDHVVEVEYALFKHTDVAADAHDLPFDDETFSAIIVLNAFEHYREPHRVAAELARVLKTDGRVLIATAFMQPLHEAPWHFFNCTRYGLEEWFKGFDAERLEVPGFFSPNFALGWMAAEAETALRADLGDDAAEDFTQATMGQFIDAHRDLSKREFAAWMRFHDLPQSAQGPIAAGFEYIGRKADSVPDLRADRIPSSRRPEGGIC